MAKYTGHEPLSATSVDIGPQTRDPADRIAELEAALRKINALIDSPARFNPEVQAVLDSVIDTSDTKF